MKSKLKFLILFAVTLIMLAYLAARILVTDIPVKQLKVSTNTGHISNTTRDIITANIQNLHKIPALLQENVPYIENVIVLQSQDGTAVIRVFYKNIVAAWEYQGFLFPLLENGEHMMVRLTQGDMETGNYFIFTGAKPKNPVPIIELIQRYTLLANQVRTIQYIEGRRFNLNLVNNRVIMLPENDIESALVRIRESGILSKNFTRLDLRNPGRMLVTR